MHGDGMLIEWEDALEMNVARTGTVAYRTKCAESHPNHEHWRKEMIRMATDTKTYPPITRQIQNALGALGRAGEALATGQPVLATEEEQARRLAICESNVCGKYDSSQRKCSACGCFANLKKRLSTEHCPLDPPLW
jgi:hypothetical protein